MKSSISLALVLASAFPHHGKTAPSDYPPSLPDARLETYRQLGDLPLKIYIFTPAAKGTNQAAIVFFHGGGWTQGSPAQFAPHCRHFAARGMVAMTVDYRVSSRNNSKPADSVNDAKACLRWVRQNAHSLGINQNRIVVAGGSAGGHLAASTGLLPGFEDRVSRVDSQPNALVLFNPVLMLAPYAHLPVQGYATNFTTTTLGGPPAAISPLHHVRTGLPPTLILHGTADTVVPFFSVEAFGQAMTQAGNRCEIVGYQQQEHGFFNFGRGNNDFYQKTLRAAVDFLVSLGYLPPAPTDAPPNQEAAKPKLSNQHPPGDQVPALRTPN